MMRIISTHKVDKLQRYWINVRYETDFEGPWLPIWCGGLKEDVSLDDILGEVFGTWSMLYLEQSAARCMETLGLEHFPGPGQLQITITKNRKKGKRAYGYVQLGWKPHVYVES